MRIKWLNANVPSANCRTAEGMRGSARRLASFSIAPGAALLDSAATIAARHGDGRGRVQAAGAFADEAVLAALRAALPPDLAQAVRPRFEWYSCRGAHFHNDAHYGDVLFGAWCVAGPATDIVFPRTGWRVASTIGTAIVFDPFEAHGVLAPGKLLYAAEDYAHAAPNVFLAFEIELSEAVRAAFGIDEAACDAIELSSERPVNAETGAVS